MKHRDRLNRIVFGLVALGLLAAGAYALARGYGAFGTDRATQSVLSDRIRTYISDNTSWFWPVVAILGLLLAVIGARWLQAQVRPVPSVREWDVARDEDGVTTLRAPAAATAFAQDVAGLPHVTGASAWIVEGSPDLEVIATVDVSDDATLQAVRADIHGEPLQRLTRAVEAQTADLRIRFQFAGTPARSVE